MKKKFYCKRTPEYSIQFWYDRKKNIWMCTETANNYKCKDFPHTIDMGLFGFNIFKSKILNKKEKKRLYFFCSSYMEAHEQNEIMG